MSPIQLLTFLQYISLFDLTIPAPQCNENGACTIHCDTNYECRDATVTCPSYYQCDIYCSAFASCQRIKINPPQNQSLFKLVSTGERALYSVHLPLEPYRDDYTDYALTCRGYETYGWTHIICPQHAHCSIDCVSNGACKVMTVNCPSEAEWECNILIVRILYHVKLRR